MTSKNVYRYTPNQIPAYATATDSESKILSVSEALAYVQLLYSGLWLFRLGMYLMLFCNGINVEKISRTLGHKFWSKEMGLVPYHR